MDNIIFEFVRDDRAVVFDGSRFAVSNYSGIDAADFEFVTEENLHGIGSRLRRRKMLPRNITLEVDYRGYADRADIRQELLAFFDPFHTGTLYINYMGTRRQIDYEVAKPPTFSSKNVFETLSFLLELTCMDPALLSDIGYSEQISTWVGGLKFPFRLSFHLRRRGESQTAVTNGGNMDTPVLVEFHGPAVNPVVTNVTTGERIKVNCTLAEGEILEINTDFGVKSVYRVTGSNRESLNQVIDISSRFFWLRPGTNYLSYDSDNKETVHKVAITWHERYLGI